MKNTIRYIFLTIIVILLILALVTDKWQTLSLKNNNIHTDIGLWKTCSVLENEETTCHTTKLSDDRTWELYGIRIIAITGIILVILSCILVNKDFNILIKSLSILSVCTVPFLYSVYMENYFSQEFDELMLSKYNYSYYLQSCGALMLIITNLFLC
uniref:Uncharacterized protein n=1 Tax=viral metagenome TaxID=1070528 RepID=A0A6C0LZD6_9ZZZZ